jgi:hypothetical protein
MVTHLGTQGTLDQGLLERSRRVFDRIRRHRSFYELIKQLGRYRRQHRRLRGCVCFLASS